MMPPLLLCFDFIHHLLRERGLVGLFLADQAAIDAESLKKQFQHTDAAADMLKKLPRGQENRMTALRQALEKLPDARASVLDRAESSADSLGWYSSTLIDPAESLCVATLIQNNRSDAVLNYAFINLVRWQILLADMRETGVMYAAPEWMHDSVKTARLRAIAKEQQAYERHFFGLADDTLRQIYRTTIQSYPVDTKLVDDSSLLLTSDRKLFLLPENETGAADWFAAFTGRIEILFNVARAMLGMNGDLLADVLAENATAAAMDSDVEAHYELIRTLPLFRGLAKSVLDHILLTAHLVSYEKNTLFLTQGETAPRLFIVLDGWAKLYKTAPSGEESILHMAGKRDTLFDSNALTAHNVCPVSARAITKVWLLSLSGATLREASLKYRDLTAALFMAINQRFQKLVGQYEQMTLRKAQERLGWFLLTLNKDIGVDGQPLTLPYDKALIASYLNIKPETLSRALKDLRDKGFKIERDQITLPHPKALCDFCDHDIAGRCCHANEETCPRPDLRVARAR